MSEIDDLQTRLAFHEQTILELDEALRSQQHQIMQLERTMQRLQSELRAMASSTAVGRPEDEPPPPHY
jgi:SlyX protein